VSHADAPITSPATSTALELRRNDIGAMSDWASLPDSNLRSAAARAAGERDIATLWSLTRSHLMLTSSRAGQISRHTLRAYRRGVEDALRDLESDSILDPKRNWASAYRARLSAQFAPATVDVRLAAGRALYAALRWSGATAAHPFEGVGGMPDPTPRWQKRQPYSEPELERLLAVADPRERVIVLLGAHAGLRSVEMVGIEPAHVDLGNRRLLIKRGKGGKAASVPISSSLLEALRDYQPTHGKETLLGVRESRLRAIIARLLLRAGGEHSFGAHGLHSLRHSSGTRMYRQTRDLILVRDHLRHASVADSDRYAKADGRLEQLVTEW
jgi:integrase/recombinase XerC